MNDWISILLTTIIAPATAAIVAYMVARPKQRAEVAASSAHANGEQATTADKYRAMLNDEIERRKLINDECEQAQDALKQCVEENSQLREENAILRKLCIANNIRFQDLIRPKGVQ